MKPSRQGERSVATAKLNRNKILMELLKDSLTFTTLKAKVGLSAKTLAQHLKNLHDEDLVKREIRGKYIVYTIRKPQTIVDMRKDLLNEFGTLAHVYNGCLDKRTYKLFGETIKSLQESIANPEPEVQTAKVMGKRIPIPKGFKGKVTQSIDNIYGKPVFEESEEPRKHKPFSFARKRGVKASGQRC